MSSALDGLPQLGAGISYRREFHDDVLAAAGVDFLEIIAERYFAASRQALQTLAALRERYAMVPHGLGLSVGTQGSPSNTMLSAIAELCRLAQAPYYSDHLAFCGTAGIDLYQLSPIVYDERQLRIVVDNIDRIQRRLRVPLVLENIAETLALPGADLTRAEFFRAVVDASGCGMLLDIANLYINAVNEDQDPWQQALAMPLDAVVQVHLAGGKVLRGRLMDTHSEAVPGEVWALYEKLVPRMPRLKAVVVERDANFPPFGDLVAEVARARLAL